MINAAPYRVSGRRAEILEQERSQREADTNFAMCVYAMICAVVVYMLFGP